MAITTYTELKSAITDYMARSDLTGNVEDFIALAEARLNRLLKMVETDTTLTGTAASRRIDISSLSLIQPIALFVVVNGDEVEISRKPDGSFAYDDTAGLPSFYGLDGTNIDFDRPLDQAYTFRFRYQGRFALSVGSPTNKLLTDHPDVYLAASIVWGSVYIKDVSQAAGFKSLLDEFIAETKNLLSQSKRGTLTVDPALVRSFPWHWESV